MEKAGNKYHAGHNQEDLTILGQPMLFSLHTKVSEKAENNNYRDGYRQQDPTILW